MPRPLHRSTYLVQVGEQCVLATVVVGCGLQFLQWSSTATVQEVHRSGAVERAVRRLIISYCFACITQRADSLSVAVGALERSIEVLEERDLSAVVGTVVEDT